ncbi:hypothetical protein M8818_000698 [Zalaria obscura]|uniref:Uncharacterized protein n=1 Tax=Zalaria obscura TaxID=2024903 RepID=A0ACC3SMF9_9PEZI
MLKTQHTVVSTVMMACQIISRTTKPIMYKPAKTASRSSGWKAGITDVERASPFMYKPISLTAVRPQALHHSVLLGVGDITACRRRDGDAGEPAISSVSKPLSV